MNSDCVGRYDKLYKYEQQNVYIVAFTLSCGPELLETEAAFGPNELRKKVIKK